MKTIVLVFIFQMSLESAESCWGCQKFTYKPYIERVKFLVRLPDFLRIFDLSLMGSHSSLSYTLPEDQRTQDLTLKQQLKYGVRAFDFEVFPKEDLEFKIFDLNLDEVLEVFDQFLDDNPGEILFVFLRSLENTIRNCEILGRYFNFRRAGRRLVNNWTLKDTLEMHRGKILLASLDPNFAFCSLDLRHCLIQSDLRTDYGGSIKAKWQSIHVFVIRSQFLIRECYINDLSFKEATNSRKTVALVAGYSAEGSCRRPLNDLMVQEFKRPHMGYSVLFGDFLSQELIDVANDANFRDSKWRIGWD